MGHHVVLLTRTEFDVLFEIDQSELEQVSVSQYETHTCTSDQNTCYLQEKQMCEKLADHKTTVYVHMFNSCFHIEHASQDRDILEVNCVHHIIRSIKIMKLCSHAIYVIRQHQIKDQSLYLCQKLICSVCI